MNRLIGSAFRGDTGRVIDALDEAVKHLGEPPSTASKDQRWTPSESGILEPSGREPESDTAAQATRRLGDRTGSRTRPNARGDDLDTAATEHVTGTRR